MKHGRTDSHGIGFMIHEEKTKKILQAFYKVYGKLGYGFLEKIYANAMNIELTKAGMAVDKEVRIDVYYDGAKVGEYFADLIVDSLVVLELKAVDRLRQEHESQLINYLRATDFEVGLLLNFGREAEFKRKIFTNDRKVRK